MQIILFLSFLICFLFFPAWIHTHHTDLPHFFLKWKFLVRSSLICSLSLILIFRIAAFFSRHKVYRFMLWLLGLVIFTMMFFDFMLINTIGRPLSKEMFALFSFKDMVGKTGIELLRYAFNPWALLATVIVPATLLAFFLARFRGSLPSKWPSIIMIIMLGFLMKDQYRILHGDRWQQITSSPVIGFNFSNMGLASFFKPTREISMDTKSVEELRKKHFSQDEENYVFLDQALPFFKMGKLEYCLMQKGASDSSCKPLREERGALRLKNVVVLSLESLRALSFDALSPFWENLTPKLSAIMKEQGSWFGRAFSVAAPTDRALGSALCSAPAHMTPMPRITGPYISLVCMMDVLTGMGYRGVRMQAGDAGFQNLSGWYLFHGVHENYGADDLVAKYNINGQAWGARPIDDEQLFDSARTWIEGHRVTAPDKRFYMVVETLGTHAPYPEDRLKPYEGITMGPEVAGSNTDTLSYHKTVRYADDVVSKFLQWLIHAEDGKLLQETLVVVMADHPPWFAEPKMGSLMPDQLRHTWIPLFFLGLDAKYQGYQDILAANTDIVPTLFGAMNIKPPNAFIGRDLFSRASNTFWAWNGSTLFKDDLAIFPTPWRGFAVWQVGLGMKISPKGESRSPFQKEVDEYQQMHEHMSKLIYEDRSYVPAMYSREQWIGRPYSFM